MSSDKHTWQTGTVRRIFSALLLSAFALTSCGGETVKPVAEDTSAGETGGQVSDLYSDLPTADYGGKTFTFFNNSMTYAEYRIDAETQNGETFNDAAYNRTRKLEEMLNIKVATVEQDAWNGSTQTYLNNLAMSGDNSIDAAFVCLMHASVLVGNGIFADLNSIDELNFDKPWWNERSRRCYEFGGKLYLAHCDANINFYDCLWSCFFNKAIAKDIKADIYSIVSSGKWTQEKLLELMETAARDLDGNGEMGADDRWGLMTHNSALDGFLHACDERGIELISGTPTVVKVDDRMFDAISSVREIFASSCIMTNNKHQSTFGYTCVNGFASGKGLFLVEVLGNAAALRDMETDFGIIPLPKFDESQEDYVSFYGGSAEALCVLKTASDLSYVGTVLEVMNALSYETVLPAYFDVVLTGKNTRDNESVEMLNIMFGNTECELASLFKWGNYNSALTSVMTTSAEIVSTLDSARPAAEAAIQTFMENIG